MEENEINQRLSNNLTNENYDSGECINNQEKSEYITFNREDNSILNDKYIYNPNNETSSIKYNNSVMQVYHSIENFHPNKFHNYNRFTYNYNHNMKDNKYSDNSLPINAIENENYVNRRTYANRSQDFSPYFGNNKMKYNQYNRSLLYNGNTTDEGDSYINPNRDSNYNNKNSNPNIKMNLVPQMNYQMEDQLNDSGNSNEEQLIIYPEKQYIYVDEKYFSKKNNEGILRPKNLETYEVRSIEYIPDEDHKFKSISLGDYLLQKGGNVKLRKNKSCNNINSKKKVSEKEYDIKLLSNKKKAKRKISSDVLNSIKTLKENYINKKINLKEINNINIIKNENNKEYLSFDEISKIKGGIVDLSDRTKYSGIMRDSRYSNREYPMWKIVASACLIQSWFRSLKRLKLSYKKNLHKIIIIQKVYKMHYKNKILSSKRKPNIYKNYKKEPNEDLNHNNYIDQKIIRYKNNSYKQMMQKYKKTVPMINNSNSEDNNYNNLKIYNKQRIATTNNNYSFKEKTIKRRTYYFQNRFSNFDTNHIIAILLMEKIIENKLLKIYFDCLFRIKNYNKQEIKSDSACMHKIKLNLEPTVIKRNKIKITSIENDFINKKIIKKEESYNKNVISLNNDNKYNFNLKQKFLLKKLFIRIWLRQAMRIKYAKRAHFNDRFKKKKAKHILLSNINKFVLEKIMQEVKRRKLIVYFDIVNRKKYPNLKYAFKKIKKFSKVRYNVLNNYASIIQNAFRYYLENKYKKGK